MVGGAHSKIGGGGQQEINFDREVGAPNGDAPAFNHLKAYFTNLRKTTSAESLGAIWKKSPQINSILSATPYMEALWRAYDIFAGSMSMAITEKNLFHDNPEIALYLQ